jgi:hypothetical protein
MTSGKSNFPLAEKLAAARAALVAAIDRADRIGESGAGDRTAALCDLREAARWMVILTDARARAEAEAALRYTVSEYRHEPEGHRFVVWDREGRFVVYRTHTGALMTGHFPTRAEAQREADLLNGAVPTAQTRVDEARRALRTAFAQTANFEGCTAAAAELMGALDAQDRAERFEVQADAEAYRYLREQISATMADPNRWDGDDAEEYILAQYVRWLADGQPDEYGQTASSLVAQAALRIVPCPAPDVVNGYDTCAHGRSWPCPDTVLGWRLRGLDPDEMREAAANRWRAEMAALSAEGE